MDLSVFNELRLQGLFCDVIINVNGITFNAHKIILCNCSPYFRELFTGAWSSAEKNVYNIPNVSPAMMRFIIDYAYTGTVPITTVNVIELLVAADQFNVMGIVSACCQFLEGQLTVDNCIGMWKFTQIYHLPELRQKAFIFILQQFEVIVKDSAEFLELTATELTEIIEKDELNCKHEDIVFEAVLQWIDHYPSARKQCISQLLPKVRLARVNRSNIVYNLKNNKYIKRNKECKDIMKAALKASCAISRRGLNSDDWVNPLTRPRLPHSIMISVTGSSDDSISTNILAYNIRADQWETIATSEEIPRNGHGSAHFKGSVYIIGGAEDTQCTNKVTRFNLETKTFQEVAPMHHDRAFHSVAVLDKFIYAIGGTDGSGAVNTVERYDPETNEWTLVAPMNESRQFARVTTLFGKICVCGGLSEDKYLRTAEVYSPETNEWTMIAPMFNRRCGHGVFNYKGKIYAVGGFDGQNHLSSVECYCPYTNLWTTLPCMINPRSLFGVGVVEDLLVIMGGLNSHNSNLCDEFLDLETNQLYDGNYTREFTSALSCCVVPGSINLPSYAACP